MIQTQIGRDVNAEQTNTYQHIKNSVCKLFAYIVVVLYSSVFFYSMSCARVLDLRLLCPGFDSHRGHMHSNLGQVDHNYVPRH